jgi:hypothetical protein
MKKTTIFLKTTLFSALLVGLSLCLFWACNKQQDENAEIKKMPKQEVFQKVASFLSNSTKDKIVQQQILATYRKKGIEEFLLADFLKNNGSNFRSSNVSDELNHLVLDNPMLTIAYPSLAFKEESFEEHLDKIDYTVMLFDDIDEVSELPAFDSEGRLVHISSDFDENIRYCVVKYNEAYIAVNSSTLKTFFEDDVPRNLFETKAHDTIGEYLMYSAADLINSRLKESNTYFRGGGEGAADSCELPCERDCFKTKDELHRVKWSTKHCLKTVEDGFHLPQVEMIAYYAIPQYATGTIKVDLVAKDVFMHWQDMTGKFSEPIGQEIATWKPELGDRWQVLWIERDYWNSVQSKFTIGFTVGFKVDGENATGNASLEITSMKKDKEIGSSLIEYCDKAQDEGDVYKPLSCGGVGGFWFREHVRDK